MSKTKTQPTHKLVQVRIDADLHNRFKAAVASEGKKIKEVIIEFVEAYLEER